MGPLSPGGTVISPLGSVERVAAFHTPARDSRRGPPGLASGLRGARCRTQPDPSVGAASQPARLASRAPPGPLPAPPVDPSGHHHGAHGAPIGAPRARESAWLSQVRPRGTIDRALRSPHRRLSHTPQTAWLSQNQVLSAGGHHQVLFGHRKHRLCLFPRPPGTPEGGHRASPPGLRGARCRRRQSVPRGLHHRALRALFGAPLAPRKPC